MWKVYIFYKYIITFVFLKTILGHEACPKISPGPLTLGNLQFGIHMKTSCFRSFYGVSITECATECLLRKSRCKSINYWRISLKCQLCQNTTGDDNMEPSDGGVHSDISTWSESFASSCAGKTCMYLERCMPDRAADPSHASPSNANNCHISECPLPERKPGAAIEQETRVGVTLRYTCINKRLNTKGNPFITCQSNGNWTSSNFSCDPWELVFRITPGIGGDVYDAWKSNGPHTTNSDINCQTLGPNTNCKHHFRSPILDRWSSEVKSMVKLGIYVGDKEVHNITFDANGSDAESWFSREKVMNTTYSGIMKTSTTFNHFSIKGLDQDVLRRFYINRNFGGCEIDFGWMMVVAKGTSNTCSYDRHESFPAIVYMKNPEGGTIDAGWNVSDTLGVFIYHEL